MDKTLTTWGVRGRSPAGCSAGLFGGEGMDKLGFEWEALFDRQGMTPLDELLMQVRKTGIPVGRFGYRTRTIISGPIVEVEIYPIYSRRMENTARRAKKMRTPEQMERANYAAAIRKVIRLANANFTENDIHLTLTYAVKPASYEQAQKDVRNFLRRVRRLREKRGLEPEKYIYAIEDEEDGEKKRIHCHMLLSGGIEREELEACWKKGWANADRLQPDEKGLAAIAKYITKSQRNRKKWVSSRNLKKPKVRTSDTKLSNRRVQRLADELPAVGKEILRKAYPECEPVDVDVYRSDVMPGVFIRAQMKRTKRNGT